MGKEAHGPGAFREYCHWSMRRKTCRKESLREEGWKDHQLKSAKETIGNLKQVRKGDKQDFPRRMILVHTIEGSEYTIRQLLWVCCGSLRHHLIQVKAVRSLWEHFSFLDRPLLYYNLREQSSWHYGSNTCMLYWTDLDMFSWRHNERSFVYSNFHIFVCEFLESYSNWIWLTPFKKLPFAFTHKVPGTRFFSLVKSK